MIILYILLTVWTWYRLCWNTYNVCNFKADHI